MAEVEGAASEVTPLEAEDEAGEAAEAKVVAAQAASLEAKKEAAAETLRESRDELARSESEADDKRAQAKPGEGEEVLKGEEVRHHGHRD